MIATDVSVCACFIQNLIHGKIFFFIYFPHIKNRRIFFLFDTFINDDDDDYVMCVYVNMRAMRATNKKTKDIERTKESE